MKPQEHDVLKEYIKEKYNGDEEKLKFYIVEYDIKFKENVASPVESGKYYEVLTLEEREDKWLINGDIHKAIKDNDNITILET